MTESERYWIGEVPARCVKTVIVKAGSFKEAQEKLWRGEDTEGVNVNYYSVGKGKIVREDSINGKAKKGGE